MRIDFPPEFDPAYYGRIKSYLPTKPNMLRAEFDLYGKKSGSPGSHFCYRENVLKALGKINGPVLEIGPGHAPDFIGDNVKYLDIVSREELQKLYPELPERNGGAPRIDYLVQELAEGKITDKFDLVYSAHNFEHQANCVMHLNSIAEILNPGGYFVAAIPDKKFTFDYYRNTATLVDILSAPGSQTAHSMRTRMESRVTAHNDALKHWLGIHGESNINDDSVIETYLEGDERVFKSHHVNAFEPDAFKSVFGLLSRKGIVKLDLLRVYNTPFARNEFMVVFRKNGGN